MLSSLSSLCSIQNFIPKSTTKLNLVINGNFSSPVVPANTPLYVSNNGTIVPNWFFYATTIISSSTAWNFPSPYPNGSQIIVMQNSAMIYQYINLQQNIIYTLSFYACGRPYDTIYNPTYNTINVALYTGGTNLVVSIVSYTPPSRTVWTQYTTTFTVPYNGLYNLRFTGTAVNNESTGIQGIVLTS